ncbi:MAG: LysR family transcriptional regulator [Burkholderiaceae bacterium]
MFEQFRRPYDLQNLYVNLRQWRILHAVVDCDGFSEAAEFLHMSQSAVSYSVSKLQEQLCLPLFNPGRKLELTSAGRALLDRSRLLLKEAVELEQCADQLRRGIETEIKVVVDLLFPSDLLIKALSAFSKRQPHVSIRLCEVSTADTEKMLQEARPDLTISASGPLAYLGEPLLRVSYVAVAHASHPLAQLHRPITSTDLAEHICVGTDSGPKRNFGSHRITIWTMGTIQAAVGAVEAGLGYGWLPRHHIAKPISGGNLVELSLSDNTSYVQTLCLIQTQQHPGHTAYTDLVEVVRELISGQPEDLLL